MITRRWLVLLVVGALAVAALVAVKSLSGDQKRGSPGVQVSPRERPKEPASGTPGGTMKMRLTDSGDVQVDVPRAAYVSRYNERLHQYDPPAPISPGPITLTAREDPKRAGRSPVVYVTDGKQKVTDVMVIGGSRLRGRLTELQWLLTKAGVELVWDAQGHDSWVVERDGKILTTSADGRYVDSGRVSKSRRYTVRLVEQVDITIDGKTQATEKGTTYVLLLPAFDSSLLSQPLPKVAADRRPGLRYALNTERASAEAREVARFLEWNSFIGEEYVGSSACGTGNDIDKFGGDNRGFSDVPAIDAFEADGTTRSRITSRVGSSWSLTDETDLNAEIYDDWFYRATGTSHAYTADGELLRQKNVGAGTIVLKESWSDDEKAWRLVEQRETPSPVERSESPRKRAQTSSTSAWHGWSRSSDCGNGNDRLARRSTPTSTRSDSCSRPASPPSCGESSVRAPFIWKRSGEHWGGAISWVRSGGSSTARTAAWGSTARKLVVTGSAAPMAAGRSIGAWWPTRNCGTKRSGAQGHCSPKPRKRCCMRFTAQRCQAREKAKRKTHAPHHDDDSHVASQAADPCRKGCRGALHREPGGDRVRLRPTQSTGTSRPNGLVLTVSGTNRFPATEPGERLREARGNAHDERGLRTGRARRPGAAAARPRPSQDPGRRTQHRSLW